MLRLFLVGLCLIASILPASARLLGQDNGTERPTEICEARSSDITLEAAQAVRASRHAGAPDDAELGAAGTPRSLGRSQGKMHATARYAVLGRS